MKFRFRNYLLNLIFPSVVLGCLTGVLTALTVILFKLCANFSVEFSRLWYGYVEKNLFLIPLVIVLLFLIALVLFRCYKRRPNLRGGGIPTSIGVLRGILPFRWFESFAGVFLLSLAGFSLGLPLGTEGPSVQIGTAVGAGSAEPLKKKHRAWKRYSMTGGACAGFAVATGAPISGILFAIEEAHEKISPMLIMVSAISVICACITTELVSPLVGVSVSLFPYMQHVVLGLKELWIPLVIGVVGGLFAVLFLKYYKIIRKLLNKKLKNVRKTYKIFAILTAVFICGLLSFSFVSTGHELIIELTSERFPIYFLLLVLIVRSTLTLFSNAGSLTGGVFIPILAVGAVLASLLAQGMELAFGLDKKYYELIVILGITACIASTMKMPLTAIAFSIEALSCYNNVLSVIIVSAISFIITEVFEAKSINESVLEGRINNLNNGEKPIVIEAAVEVKEDSFAVGKQIRDILWPANFFVLSLEFNSDHHLEFDDHGGRTMRVGDVLNIRYSTVDPQYTKMQILAILGEQDYIENQKT